MTPMPHVLVIGAAGFIGSHVAEHGLKLGFKVLATDDLSGGFLKNVPKGCLTLFHPGGQPRT